MRKFTIVIIMMFFLISCTNKEFIISIEQPKNSQLDDLKVEINLDRKKVKEIYLKSTNVVPTHETIKVFINEEGIHHLEIKLIDTTFSYSIIYPGEKYIILSPYLKKNGKISIGILKQQEKFTFH
ncbi:hypothetical protein [Flavobacterium sp. KMS]|uniref:hypothetical protein n=1 Tax=Flavobacterium sp. KMS TaxID=1566023 RepID=UPI000A8567E6|nr:hypothetical protein [Flavobacterium sp. KMS]